MQKHITDFFKKRDVQVIAVVVVLIVISIFVFTKPAAKTPPAYVRITVGNETRTEKLTPHEVTIDQDGGKQNVIAITEHGVHMKSATCENQDCVQQGEVTEQNVASRLLMNWIICLPNQVSIELITEEEK